MRKRSDMAKPNSLIQQTNAQRDLAMKHLFFLFISSGFLLWTLPSNLMFRNNGAYPGQEWIEYHCTMTSVEHFWLYMITAQYNSVESYKRLHWKRNCGTSERTPYLRKNFLKKKKNKTFRFLSSGIGKAIGISKMVGNDASMKFILPMSKIYSRILE